MVRVWNPRKRVAYGSIEDGVENLGNPETRSEPRKWVGVARSVLIVAAVATTFAAVVVPSWRGASLSREEGVVPGSHDVTGFRADGDMSAPLAKPAAPAPGAWSKASSALRSDKQAVAGEAPAAPGVGIASVKLAQPVDLYVVNKGEGTILRARVEELCSEAATEASVLVKGLPSPKDVFVDVEGNAMYWTDMEDAVIMRSTLEGGALETIVTGTPKPALLAMDLSSRRMYWTDKTADEERYVLRTADMDGNMEFPLAQLEAQSLGIAWYGGKLYWTESDLGVLQSSLGYSKPVVEKEQSIPMADSLHAPMYLEVYAGKDLYAYVGGTGEEGRVLRYTLGEDGKVVGSGEDVLRDVYKADAIRYDADNDLLWVTLYYDWAVVAVDLKAAAAAGVVPSMTEHRGLYCINVITGLNIPKGLQVIPVTE